MKFSVLMSVYINEKAEYLDQCFSSIASQTMLPNEVVVVQDGPLTDALYRVIAIWKLKLPIVDVVLEKNCGLGVALNEGLENCSNELVARVDTDDVNNDTRFERQIELFNSDINLAICGSQIDEVTCETLDLMSRRKVKELNCDILKESVVRNPFNHMTVMFKKSIVKSVGGYQHMTSMEDWYLWLRILSKGYKGYNIQESLVYARTGKEMMVRRSGLKYVGYEMRIARAKWHIFHGQRLRIIFSFLIRAAPRILPKYLLHRVYLLSRRNNAS
ncbi:glycosyltransferase [Vibrio cyclitrophicus]